MTNSDYIAIASALIAFLALVTTIAQLRSVKKHSILSVRPLIRFHIKNDDILSYSFENHGLGPGLIKEFTINIAGRKLVNPTREQFHSTLAVVPGNHIQDFEYEFHLPVVGAAYKPGQIVELLRFSPLASQKNISSYKFLEEKIEIILLYQSVYGEQVFGCGTRNHS